MRIDKVNVVCMKWGTLYGSNYVNKLYGMVVRHLSHPFNFYCITDDNSGIRKDVQTLELPDFPLPPGARGPWQKLLMFQEKLFDIQGKTMFLDLDVVIVGSLDRFFTFSDKFAVRHEFDKRKETDNFGNTSMYVFNVGSYPDIFNYYMQNQQAVHDKYYSAEQEYVTRTLHDNGEIDFFPNKWILSFKEHCLPSWPKRLWRAPQLPPEASILAFHGRPLPEDAIAGTWPLDGKPFWKRIYKYTKPCPWLAEHWNE